MTSDYENFPPLNIKKNIKINIEFVKGALILKFDKYKVVFNPQSYNCCNWPGAWVKRKKILDLFEVKNLNMGYVKKIKLNFGKEIIIRKDIKNKEIIKIENNKNNSFDDNSYKTTNVFSLTFDKNKKLLFCNGNNNGYYSYDFIIYKDDKIIFKSSL